MLIVVGVLIAITGALWTLSGLGFVHGSGMTGVTSWPVSGPVVALAGLAMAVAGLRGRR